MELTRPFSRLGKDDAHIAGGKGASLGEMTQAWIPVPPGFVVLASTFERFLEETDLTVEIDAILATVEHEKMHTVEHASERIQALIHEAKMPEDIAADILSNFKALGAEFVAVRSSATAEDSASAAWAGQLDSYLNTTEAELLVNVQRCWASLFTPRAIFYRFEKGLDTQKISVAVVVQKMVNSDASGIAFSVHPVTEDYNQLIIEAGFGLGEAVVSGQITPDSYVVTKQPREIIDTNISEQSRGLYRKQGGGNEWQELGEKGKTQVISNEQILTLSETICGIERHYGFPCDIEWAQEGDNFYIVQSRPITTLSADHNPVSPSGLSDLLTTLEIDRPEKWFEEGTWVQSPFSNVFFSNSYTADSVRKVLPDITFHPGFIIDYRYFSYAQDHEALRALIKTKYTDGTLGALVTLFDTESEAVLEKLTTLLAKSDSYIEEHIQEVFDAYHEFTGLWMCAAHLGSVPTHLAKDVGYVTSDAELFERVHPYLRPTWIEHEIQDVRAIATEIARKQSNPTAESLSSLIEQDPALTEAVRQYLEKYSWIRINKWVGEPIDMEFAYARILEEVQNVIQGNYIETSVDVSMNETSANAILELSASTAYWRTESAKTEMVTAHRLRFLLDKIGEKNELEYSQVLLLSPKELVQVVGSPSQEIPEKERLLARAKSYFCIGFDTEEIVLSPEDLDFKRIQDLYRPVIENAANDTLHGTGAAPGKAKGRVRIVETASDFTSFEEGEILVAPETTPSFVPLMRKAAAVLTGKGGITSHAAIVSRELKKPCVIGIPHITHILKTGDEVEVDADAGIVRRINISASPIVLSKVYGREKPLFYFVLWQADDKKALKEYIDQDLTNDLFVVPPPGQGGSIWYGNAEFERLLQLGLEKVNSSDEFAQELVDHAKRYWKLIAPYLVEKKRCSTADEMYEYYQNLVDFWMPMNSVFFMLPDKENISPVFKEGILAVREVTQEYTEEMPRVFMDFFTMRFPDLAHLAYFATPEETVRLDKELDPKLLEELETRARIGCFMFEGQIYLLDRLDAVLAEHNLVLETFETNGTTSLVGQTAYKGQAIGPVCLIRTKADTKKMKQGDILVAAMTNPDFVPIMKIAGAIVTDEGGLTCHAAIASREMQVPCVVGTKMATHVFKDGDMVEVDADVGMVRKV